MTLSNIQAGCFPGIKFWKVFRRRDRAAAPVFYDHDMPAPSNRESNHVHDSSCLGLEKEWAQEKDVLPAYSENGSFSSNNTKIWTALSPEIVNTIDSKLDDLNDELRELSLRIHARPEIAFEERYAHDVLTAFMEKHGFKVTRSYAGLDTAWRAEYTIGRGGRVLGINSEMDALPGIGHACGHNLIAITGVGIAVALKTALEAYGVPSKVVILGTPAEEGGGGKVILLQRGAYDDMDVCIMSHPTAGHSNSIGFGTTTATHSMLVEYFGKSAHAAASPWEGRNALDAAVLAYTSISALRQQLKPELRVHGIIEGRDWVPNVIPDYARLTYIIRAPNPRDVAETVARVKGCFEGAGHATSCEVKIRTLTEYSDLRQNPVLARELSDNVEYHYNMVTHTVDSGASTDFGNVTYELPALHANYAIPTEPNGGNHTPGFARSAMTQEAHKATMKVAKGLALTGFRVLCDSAFFEEVQQAFQADKNTRGGCHMKN